MGTIRKRGRRFYAEVCVQGTRRGKSFASKTEARVWVDETESLLTGGITTIHTLHDALLRAEDAKPDRKDRERLRLLRSRLDFVGTPISEVRPAQVAEWRDKRLTEVSSSTVRRELTMLSAVFTLAIQEWGWCRENPVRSIRRPLNRKPRNRLVSHDEQRLIVARCGWQVGTPIQRPRHEVAIAFLLALETAMRASEILRLSRADIQGSVALVRTSKNGNPRHVPLSPLACELLDHLPGDACLFSISRQSLDTLFRRTVRQCGIEGLVFHDTRRTATTRLAKIFSPLELAKITGHRDLRILLNTYYQASPSEWADRLASIHEPPASRTAEDSE